MTIIIRDITTGLEIVRVPIGRFENIETAIKNILANIGMKRSEVTITKKCF
jgi:hypothetical protein